jgi:multiple sugar transport system permease protein
VAIAAFTGAVEFQRPIGTITAACVVVTRSMILVALSRRPYCRRCQGVRQKG